MRDWNTLTKLCLGGLISLVLAAPALGAPADKEYVLKIPSIAGEVVVAEGTEGPGSTILAPEVRGRDVRAAGSGSDAGSSEADSPVAQISGATPRRRATPFSTRSCCCSSQASRLPPSA
jgi:hypothetical protein